MGKVTKPILLDETGQEIVKTLRAQNAILSGIIRQSAGSLVSWKDVQSLVRQGLAKEVFQIGDQFTVAWRDVATGKTYDVPLDVVSFGDAQLEGGSVVPAMFLQWHYTLPFAIPFDAIEGTIATGTFSNEYFYYRMDGSNVSWLEAGVDYNVGDVIPSDAVYYANEMFAGDGQILKSGYNRWSHSAIRQFLNSSAQQGAWWTAQHYGDLAPAVVSDKAGFLTGFDDEFLSVIGPVAVHTLVSKAAGDGSDETFDTFFLPSSEQVNFTPSGTVGAEDGYFEYWRKATNADGFNNPAVANEYYKVYDVETKNIARAALLRSASLVSTGTIYSISVTGTRGSGACSGSRYVAPVCAIY